MAEENATTTYVIAEPFDRAVKLVRKVLTGAHLKIVGELNISGRIQRNLMIQTSPCLVLFASPATASGGFAPGPCDAFLAPLHVVVSAHGSQTDVHILRVLPREQGGTPGGQASAALVRLQMAITHAIETIGMRVGLGA